MANLCKSNPNANCCNHRRPLPSVLGGGGVKQRGKLLQFPSSFKSCFASFKSQLKQAMSWCRGCRGERSGEATAITAKAWKRAHSYCFVLGKLVRFRNSCYILTVLNYFFWAARMAHLVKQFLDVGTGNCKEPVSPPFTIFTSSKQQQNFIEFRALEMYAVSTAVIPVTCMSEKLCAISLCTNVALTVHSFNLEYMTTIEQLWVCSDLPGLFIFFFQSSLDISSRQTTQLLESSKILPGVSI